MITKYSFLISQEKPAGGMLAILVPACGPLMCKPAASAENSGNLWRYFEIYPLLRKIAEIFTVIWGLCLEKAAVWPYLFKIEVKNSSILISSPF
ncbi:hypothetical protein [Paenibacillus macerans]|uniref:hypothetical protein n=1 Tax=Paenibacillus macerans TaxID=44252 RepID=UPI00203B2ED7|nr:hypothetical protein [Paenibacillus macerans]MCM3699834.1 hypothetical protein [Paenibacillus macerans]